jgi:hypothetical protein
MYCLFFGLKNYVPIFCPGNRNETIFLLVEIGDGYEEHTQY